MKLNLVKTEAPVTVMKKSMVALATIAYVMAEKYQNGVYLYRQENYWKNNGVKLSRNKLRTGSSEAPSGLSLF